MLRLRVKGDHYLGMCLLEIVHINLKNGSFCRVTKTLTDETEQRFNRKHQTTSRLIECSYRIIKER